MQRRKKPPGISKPYRYSHSALGLYLRAHRLKASVSQRDISDRLGLTSAQFISNIERGKCAAPLSVIGVYAEMCGINKEDVLKMILQETERDFRIHLGMEPSSPLQKSS